MPVAQQDFLRSDTFFTLQIISEAPTEGGGVLTPMKRSGVQQRRDMNP
jgi:hypothetical protein